MKPKCGTAVTPAVSPARMGFGGVGLGSASGAGWRADVRLVEEAAERGVTVFDTADAYGAGASERVLGRALRHRRADVVIATKGGYRFRPRSRAEQATRRAGARLARRLRQAADANSSVSGEGSPYRDQDFSPSFLREAVEASLRRLRTDYIDVFQLHGPQDVRPDVVEELRDLIGAGKVRKLGVGTESVASAAGWAADVGLDVVQLPFGMLDPEAAGKVFPLAAENAIDVWVRGVLGGGLLKAASDASPTILRDPKWPLISSLDALSRRAGVELDELAIRFVRAQPHVSVILLGMTSREHLRRNVELMESPPLDADLISEVWQVLAGRPGGLQ